MKFAKLISVLAFFVPFVIGCSQEAVLDSPTGTAVNPSSAVTGAGKSLSRGTGAVYVHSESCPAQLEDYSICPGAYTHIIIRVDASEFCGLNGYDVTLRRESKPKENLGAPDAYSDYWQENCGAGSGFYRATFNAPEPLGTYRLTVFNECTEHTIGSDSFQVVPYPDCDDNNS